MVIGAQHEPSMLHSLPKQALAHVYMNWMMVMLTAVTLRHACRCLP